MKKCTRMNLIGVVDRGAPRKTWEKLCQEGREGYGYKGGNGTDRCAWRYITGGPTRASADA